MAHRIPPSWGLVPILLASACAPEAPPMLPSPGPSLAPAASASSLAGREASPPSQPPAQASSVPVDAGVERAGEEPAALPADSFDPGDVPAQDSEAYQKALADDGTAAYFPGDLIHDGGVILYRIQEVGLGGKATAGTWGASLGAHDGTNRADPTTGRPAGESQQGSGARPRPPGLANLLPGLGCVDTEALPDRWQRGNFMPGGRQVRLRRQGTQAALATVVAVNRGALRYQLPGRPRPQEKRFNERFTRELRFAWKNGQAQLREVGPIELTSQGGGQGKLSFASLVVRPSAGAPPLAQLQAGNTETVPVDQLPKVGQGSTLLVELRLGPGQSCPPYLFAHFLSQRGARDRVPLRDDGASGDATAADGTYSALVPVLGPEGLAHLAVEALASTSFEARNPYQALALGFSFRIQGPQ